MKLRITYYAPKGLLTIIAYSANVVFDGEGFLVSVKDRPDTYITYRYMLSIEVIIPHKR